MISRRWRCWSRGSSRRSRKGYVPVVAVFAVFAVVAVVAVVAVKAVKDIVNLKENSCAICFLPYPILSALSSMMGCECWKLDHLCVNHPLHILCSCLPPARSKSSTPLHSNILSKVIGNSLRLQICTSAHHQICTSAYYEHLNISAHLQLCTTSIIRTWRQFQCLKDWFCKWKIILWCLTLSLIHIWRCRRRLRCRSRWSPYH